MNLSEMLHDVAMRFSELPGWGILFVKATAILAAAWLMHFALARMNPRWRMFLWRGTAVGLVIVGIWTMAMPGFVIRLQVVPSTIATVAEPPNPVRVPSDSAGISHQTEQSETVRGTAGLEKNTVAHDARIAVPEKIEPSKAACSWSVPLAAVSLRRLDFRRDGIALEVNLAHAFNWCDDWPMLSRPADCLLTRRPTRIPRPLAAVARSRVITIITIRRAVSLRLPATDDSLAGRDVRRRIDCAI